MPFMMNGNAGNPTYLYHHVKNYSKLSILYICNDITHAHAYSWDSSRFVVVQLKGRPSYIICRASLKMARRD
jgi:hypothetical protein